MIEPKIDFKIIDMSFVSPQYSGGMPLYWRDETSGKLKAAIEEYLEPYALDNKIDRVEPMSAEHLNLFKRYLIYYLKAPCWRHYGNREYIDQLEKLIEQAQKIESREDITKLSIACLKIGLDPF